MGKLILHKYELDMTAELNRGKVQISLKSNENDLEMIALLSELETEQLYYYLKTIVKINKQVRVSARVTKQS